MQKIHVTHILQIKLEHEELRAMMISPTWYNLHPVLIFQASHLVNVKFFALEVNIEPLHSQHKIRSTLRNGTSRNSSMISFYDLSLIKTN